MPWELQIHHIDVNQGDATLVIAREDPGQIVRSVLIDGGLGNQAPVVHEYITNAANLAALDIMVSTHYDNDHLNGLTGLLNMNVNTYDNLRIYDQGWPVGINVNYQSYLTRINMRGNRVRVTGGVTIDGNQPGYINAGGSAFGVPAVLTPAVPVNLAIQGNRQNPNWLVGQEILWDNVIGGQPLGAPGIHCIAANRHVLQQGGGTVLHQAALAQDVPNELSLAFLISLGNFRYYIGGDIESAQEDGGLNNDDGIMHFLNQANNLQGCVPCIKCSHHGSDRSTSQGFLNRVLPHTAFISCGDGNNFGHPNQALIDRLLAANVTFANVYLTSFGTLAGQLQAGVIVNGIREVQQNVFQHVENFGYSCIVTQDDGGFAVLSSRQPLNAANMIIVVDIYNF